MCLWSAIGKTTQLHHVIVWHQGQPKKAQGHIQDEVPNRSERRAVAYVLYGSTQPICFLTRGASLALLQASEEAGQVPMDAGGTAGLRWAQVSD